MSKRKYWLGVGVGTHTFHTGIGSSKRSRLLRCSSREIIQRLMLCWATQGGASEEKNLLLKSHKLHMMIMHVRHGSSISFSDFTPQTSYILYTYSFSQLKTWGCQAKLLGVLVHHFSDLSNQAIIIICDV